MAMVVARRPEFEGLESGLDGPTIKAMRAYAGKKDHASRSIINAACGGPWMNDRRSRASRVSDEESLCSFCREGSPHVLFDCPAFAQQRKEAKVGPHSEDIPACV
eukprot:2065367-Amphidinium_carterae.2